MEEYFKQMIELLQPPSHTDIIVSGSKSRIVVDFDKPIQLNKKKRGEIALVALETYYSFPNIDANNNNFRYSPDNGSTWFNIDIPEGSYEIVDINEYIQRTMRDNGHYNATSDKYCITLESNNNTLKSVLIIDTNYKVDLTTVNSVRTVLGFNSKMYSSGYNESENIVNILSANSIFVTLDLIEGSYLNNSQRPIIYSFFPNVGPGYKIIEQPQHLSFLPVRLSEINSITVTVTDRNEKQLNLRGGMLTIRFQLREL